MYGLEEYGIKLPLKLVNEDGTDMELPETTLFERMDKDYPPFNDKFMKPCSPILGEYEDGRPIVNYSCVLCSSTKCRHSDSFIVPEEYREEYKRYQTEVKQYFDTHNPNIKENIENKLREYFEENV